MLSISGVNQYYGGSHILRDVNLQAEAGKITVLLGRNGVGKTTTIGKLAYNFKKNGKEVGRFAGVQSKIAYVNSINEQILR